MRPRLQERLQTWGPGQTIAQGPFFRNQGLHDSDSSVTGAWRTGGPA